MNPVKPWNLTLSEKVEDGITIKYCFKCWGETTAVPGTTGTSNLPSASYDNLSIRLIRNCKTHIQNVTNMANGILAPIHPGSYTHLSVKMSEMYNFIDEYDCGEVTCGLFEVDCTTAYAPEHVTMSTAHPDFTITAYVNVYKGYNYTACVKCSSISQTVTYNNFRFNVRGYGWVGQLEQADSVLPNQLLKKNGTVNSTTGATNDW